MEPWLLEGLEFISASMTDTLTASRSNDSPTESLKRNGDFAARSRQHVCNERVGVDRANGSLVCVPVIEEEKVFRILVLRRRFWQW